MYCRFFKLERMPFDNTPDPRFFFTTSEHDEALAALRYGVTQRRGFTVITGQPGSGKTLLGQMLVQSLGAQAISALISHTPEDPHDLMAALCRGLGVRYSMSHSTGELVERLHTALVNRNSEGRLAVAVLDEAQNLSVDVLEHLRMLGNIEEDTAKLLQVVLLGQSELVPVLRDAQLSQLRQRIFCSRQINPLARDQVHHYMRHRLKVAGAADAELFGDAAIDLIYDQSGGVPRMVNQIADNSLLVAYGASRPTVDRDLVAESIEQMMGVQLGRDHLAEPAVPGVRQEVRPDPVVAEVVAASRVGMVTPQAEAMLSALNEAIKQAAELAGRLSEAGQQAKARVSELANEQTTAAPVIDQLNAALAAAQSSAKAARGDTRRLDRLVKEARSAAGDLGQLSSEVTESVESLESGREELRSQLNDERAACDQQREALRSTATQLETHITRATELLDDLKATDRQVGESIELAAGCESRVTDLRRQTAEAEAASAALEQVSSRARQSAEEAQDAILAEHDNLARVILDAREGAAELSAAGRVACDTQQALEEAVAWASEQAGTQQALVDESGRRSDELANKITEAAAMGEGLQEACGRSELARQEHVAQLGELDGAKQRIRAETERAEHRVAAVTTEANATAAQVEVVAELAGEASAALNRAVDTARAQECSLGESLNVASERTGALQTRLEDTAARLDEQSQGHAGLMAESKDQQHALADQAARGATVLDTLTAACERAERLYAEQDAKHHEYVALADQAIETMDQLRDAVSATEELAHERLVQAERRIRDAVGAAEDQIGPLCQRADQLRRECADQQEALVGLVQQAGEQEKRLADTDCAAVTQQELLEQSIARSSRQADDVRAVIADSQRLEHSLLDRLSVVDAALENLEAARKEADATRAEHQARAAQLGERIDAALPLVDRLAEAADQAHHRVKESIDLAVEQHEQLSGLADESERLHGRLGEAAHSADGAYRQLMDAAETAHGETARCDEALAAVQERSDVLGDIRREALAVDRSLASRAQKVENLLPVLADQIERLSKCRDGAESALRDTESQFRDLEEKHAKADSAAGRLERIEQQAERTRQQLTSEAAAVQRTMKRTESEARRTMSQATEAIRHLAEHLQQAQDAAVVSAFQAEATAVDTGVLRAFSSELADMAEQFLDYAPVSEDVPSEPIAADAK